MILVGMSGAVTALGDTLFPPASVGQGLQQDFAAGADFLIRLRVIHPLMAATVAVAGIAWAASRRKAVGPTMARRRLAWLGGVLAVQLVAGLTNVVLLAPVWLQIFHLLLAQTAWLLLIVCLAESPMGLGETPKPAV
jgi:heme A synthase